MSNRIPVNVKLLSNYKGPVEGPKYGTEKAGAFDFTASIENEILIYPNEQALIPTGIAVALPAGKVLLVTPRSGLAYKQEVTITNSPGLIDEDYRGEVGVILRNLSDKILHVEPGDRIAQGLVIDRYQVEWNIVDDLDQTTRGTGGFGSTGVTTEAVVEEVKLTKKKK